VTSIVRRIIVPLSVPLSIPPLIRHPSNGIQNTEDFITGQRDFSERADDLCQWILCAIVIKDKILYRGRKDSLGWRMSGSFNYVHVAVHNKLDGLLIICLGCHEKVVPPIFVPLVQKYRNIWTPHSKNHRNI